MKSIRIATSLVIVMVALLVAFVPAMAAPGDTFTVTFSYSCTNNLPGDVSGSIGQFSVLVTDVSPDANHPKASFTFYNTGPFQSSITDVYFDDGVLLGISGVTNGTGTNFSPDASPHELPGANNCVPPFETGGSDPNNPASFSADSNPPTQPNGVNNYTGSGTQESVTITFDLIAGPTSWADLQTGFQSGQVRVGIHVQGYASGGSEAFVTGGGTAIRLDSFTANANRGKVALNWVTGTEIDNAGFNLYRSAATNGPRVKLNGGLIAAQSGAASGANYQIGDAPGYGTYYYWLEDVSTGGAATLHGPVVVTLSPSFRMPMYRPVILAGN